MFLSKEVSNPLIKIMAIFLLIGSIMTIGVINLSMLFDLMQEILNNADVIIGLVILSVVIGMAMKLGEWMGNLLNSAINRKK